MLSVSLFIFLSLHSFITAIATTDYLKLPLLHKNPPPTPSQALTLDTHRLSTHFKQRILKSPITSGASSGSGQYFINIHLGSPPQSLLLIADTGSDLIWTKCSACKNCTHRQPHSAFLVRHSSTFSLHHCYHKTCTLIPHPDPNPCNHARAHSPCRYEYTYADGSTTDGLFGMETTTLKTSSGNNTQFSKLNFGCGFHVSGPSVTGASFNGANGVMGLGRGKISFASQLGRKFGNKFSYCLMDYTLSQPPTSYLTIGGGASAGMAYTPLLINPLAPTFYYIRIQSIAINSFKLRINPTAFGIDESGNGGTVVDSGTTLTFLAEDAYKRVLEGMRRRVRFPRVKEAAAGFDLCVNVSGEVRPRFPRLRFKLSGGAWLSPPARNYFIETSVGVKCLGVQGAVKGGLSVIGNLMQQGFLFEFDRDRSRLGFTRHGCGLP